MELKELAEALVAMGCPRAKAPEMASHHNSFLRNISIRQEDVSFAYNPFGKLLG